jgi:hypothetical protein
MCHLHTGQSLDGLDSVTAQIQISEVGKVDMGHFLHQCCPVIAIYIIHH